jgi:hypothetical protein
MTPQDARAQITALQKQWDNNKGARGKARQLFRMAEGSWADSIPRLPDEPESHAKKRPRFAPGILGLALRQLSYLYDEEPRRDMDDESEQEWATESLHQFGLGLSESMRAADSLARLHGASLLLLTYKPSPLAARDVRAAALGETPAPDPRLPDGVEATPVPRFLWEVLANEMDARHIEAGIILIGKAGEKPVHHYWDRHYFARLVDFQTVPITDDGAHFIEHNIGDHPLVLIRNDEVSPSTIPAGLGGDDLRDNLIAIGAQWREYGWTAKLQRGQPYAVGTVKKAVLSPESMIVLRQVDRAAVEVVHLVGHLVHVWRSDRAQ